MTNQDKYYIGIDVGTQSVRGGLVTADGKVIKSASVPITTHNPYPSIYEQSSDEIWAACIKVTQTITKDINPSHIRSIGFDATCSLVAIDEKQNPLSMSKTGDPKLNIILWMDHRAFAEAQFINSLSPSCLKFVGGKISPEMQPPKLLWIKKNLPSQWKRAKYFFDLPDFLTWKATGSLSRSLCSLVCKWMYYADTGGVQHWDDDFWNKIGLEDLMENNYEKIGYDVREPGQVCGSGLSLQVARQMQLLQGTCVSTSIIDAHAGALGVLSCSFPSEHASIYSLENRMAVVCGTSTCHMKISKDPIVTPGVWGPYFSVLVPNFWCSEAGQSAAGALIDHVVNTHPAVMALKEQFGSKRHITDILNDELKILMDKYNLSSVSYLTEDIHIWPDYHGNRSPLADPTLKGMVSGLGLSADKETLAKLYLATLQALAYGTKYIIQCLEEKGHKISVVLLCGGLSKNSMYVKIHADAIGLPVIVPDEPESVLLGAALLGATAAGDFPRVIDAMSAMCGFGQLIDPVSSDKCYHEKKYQAFHCLLKCQKEIHLIMT